MSQLGQARRFPDVRRMSGLSPTPDISGAGRLFAFGPEADESRINALGSAKCRHGFPAVIAARRIVIVQMKGGRHLEDKMDIVVKGRRCAMKCSGRFKRVVTGVDE